MLIMGVGAGGGIKCGRGAGIRSYGENYWYCITINFCFKNIQFLGTFYRTVYWDSRKNIRICKFVKNIFANSGHNYDLGWITDSILIYFESKRLKSIELRVLPFFLGREYYRCPSSLFSILNLIIFSVGSL